ncbi:hypothetical protein [Peribacillus simplex]|uniref:hypothetical protein n=1 Tax=Peribacillus TaxID=2675229 RepID=UPI0036D9003C
MEQVSLAGGPTLRQVMMEKQTIKEAYQKFTVKDSKVEGVSGESIPKGTGNKTSQVPHVIIRDGSHMHKDRTLKPNVKYQAGEYEYLYETDSMGRLKEFNADDLKLTERAINHINLIRQEKKLEIMLDT